jgi:prophage regulatory protein
MLGFDLKRFIMSYPTQEAINMSNKVSTSLLKLSEVQTLAPYSKASIYRLMAEGIFPKPVKLGSRSVFWVKKDIEDFIQRSIDNSKKDAA